MVIGIFSFLWLATFTSFIGVLHAKAASAIGPTKYCVVGCSRQLFSPTFFVPVIYDTLVFLAITWKIVIDSPAIQSLGRSKRDHVRYAERE